ncbi:MAG TPA: A/G-specific adenine glycosylase [Casimicrobiaceae bacterium]|nr:A/G-specific adenine glycosylase [Casimicrobiaceae bacterium]
MTRAGRPAPAPRSFAARLTAWQRSHGRRDLPWQGTRDAYRIWLSEIMLQQTQVATVIPYYERFIAAFPDVRMLAAAPLDRVLEHWSGLGYYRRAHHLHAAAKQIVERHRGAFPRDPRAIAALPGIGRSTAAAIAAFAFGTRGAILDGNVRRLLARHRGVRGYPGETKVERELWAHAEALLPKRDIEPYTQALMDLGATICTRAAPLCCACPVATDCVALREGRIGELPSPRPRKTLPRRAVRVLLVERAGAILFEKRAAAGIWAGLWSLPEIAVDDDIARQCKARFASDIVVGEALAPIEHGFTHFHLTIHPQRITVRNWPPRAEAPGLVWLTRDDALAAALPAPIKALIRGMQPRGNL